MCKTYVLKRKKKNGRFIITCPALQGVVTEGKTPDQAVANAVDVLNLILEARGLDRRYKIKVEDR